MTTPIKPKMMNLTKNLIFGNKLNITTYIKKHIINVHNQRYIIAVVIISTISISLLPTPNFPNCCLGAQKCKQAII